MQSQWSHSGVTVADARSATRRQVFRMPGQSNRVAFLYDPLRDAMEHADVDFSFTVEIFEAGENSPQHWPPFSKLLTYTTPLPTPPHAPRPPAALRPSMTGCFIASLFCAGHITPRHSHPVGYETFFVLRGSGTAHCDGESFPVRAYPRLSLSPSLSLALSLALSHCLSLSLSLPLALPLPLSRALSLFLSLSVSLAVCRPKRVGWQCSTHALPVAPRRASRR